MEQISQITTIFRRVKNVVKYQPSSLKLLHTVAGALPGCAKNLWGWEIPEIGFTFAFAAKIWPAISPELTELSISNLQNLQRPMMSIGISFEIGGFPPNLAPRGGQSYR